MLLIRREQIEKLQEEIVPRVRKSVVESFAARGFDVEDDPENRIFRLRDKAGGEVAIQSKGSDIFLISGENRTHKFEYDSKNRLTSITDPRGFRISFHRDDQQRLIRIDRGENNAFHFQYDEFSNLVKIGFPDQTTRLFDYDQHGNLIAYIDRNGAERNYIYSVAGQLVKINDANGNETRFRYSELDAPRAIEFANGDRHEFKYDDKGALSRFYANHELVSAFKFDANNGSVEISSGSERSRISIRENRIAEAVNENCIEKCNKKCQVIFTYDYKGRVLSEEADDKTIEFTRNEIGALIEMLTPGKVLFRYDRDKENRIKGIDDWRNRHISLGYDPSGALAGISYPNGVHIQRRINPMGQVGALEIKTTRPHHETIYKADYEYDACDRVVKTIVESNGRENRTDLYTYDGEGRLLGIDSSDPRCSEIFLLDNNGNRIRDRFGESSYRLQD